MKRIAIIGLCAGLLIFICLLLWQGALEVLQLLIASGWGLLWLPLAWLPVMVPLAQAWRLCFPRGQEPALRRALLGIWLGRSVNSMLPVATIGGEIVKARVVALGGGNANAAVASVMVDKTIQAFAVVLWGLLGVVMLVYSATDNKLAMLVTTGFLILTASVAVFIYFQKAGIFGFVTRVGGMLIKTDSWEGLSQNARVVDENIKRIYGDWRRVMIATLIKTSGYVLETGELWLACYLLGLPLHLGEVLLLKSLTSTISDVAFVIPNAYGIQEGAYIMVGTLLGIKPELALAISLAIRVRLLIVDAPGLLAWHQIETRHLLKRQTV
jgi:putative membrane protein